MRGLIADVNIYSSYFTEKSMVQWTTSCDNPVGDIYAWNAKSLNITQEVGSMLNVTLVKMDKVNICPDSKKTNPKEKTCCVKWKSK